MMGIAGNESDRLRTSRSRLRPSFPSLRRDRDRAGGPPRGMVLALPSTQGSTVGSEKSGTRLARNAMDSGTRTPEDVRESIAEESARPRCVQDHTSSVVYDLIRDIKRQGATPGTVRRVPTSR